MIDLPLAEDDSQSDLPSRILLYNHLLLLFSSIIIVLTGWFLIQINSGTILVGELQGFLNVVLGIIVVIQFLDIYCWYLIRSQQSSNLETAVSIYLIPVLVDIILVFAFGLGIIAIFLRIVIYGALNPDHLYYDEEDPLFNS